MSKPQPCSCGSGEIRYPLYDGYGIFLTYICGECEDEKRLQFRQDIDSRYDCDEPIEEDY